MNDAMPVQSRDFEHFMVHMPTAFMNARIAGFSLTTATWAQALFSVIAIAAVIWTFWRRRDRDLSNALLVTATFVGTPYYFNYDMVVFGWVIITLLKRTGNDTWDYALMLAVAAVPFLTVPVGIAGIPVSCRRSLRLAAGWSGAYGTCSARRVQPNTPRSPSLRSHSSGIRPPRCNCAYR